MIIDGASPGSSETIAAIDRLVTSLVHLFGVRGTIGFLVVLVAGSIALRLYNDYRADRDTKEALREKERSIQRLSTEVRMWRALFFREKVGWDDELIERFVMKNEFHNAASARKSLEEATGDSIAPSE